MNRRRLGPASESCPCGRTFHLPEVLKLHRTFCTTPQPAGDTSADLADSHGTWDRAIDAVADQLNARLHEDLYGPKGPGVVIPPAPMEQP